MTGGDWDFLDMMLAIYRIFSCFLSDIIASARPDSCDSCIEVSFVPINLINYQDSSSSSSSSRKKLINLSEMPLACRWSFPTSATLVFFTIPSYSFSSIEKARILLIASSIGNLTLGSSLFFKNYTKKWFIILRSTRNSFCSASFFTFSISS